MNLKENLKSSGHIESGRKKRILHLENNILNHKKWSFENSPR